MRHPRVARWLLISTALSVDGVFRRRFERPAPGQGGRVSRRPRSRPTSPSRWAMPAWAAAWPTRRKSSIRCSPRASSCSGPDKPIVLVVLDWCQCNNDSYDRWRDVLAEAAGTTPERVLLSTVHQHDAPICDLTAQKLLDEHGLKGYNCDPEFHETAVQRTAAALRGVARLGASGHAFRPRAGQGREGGLQPPRRRARRARSPGTAAAPAATCTAPGGRDRSVAQDDQPLGRRPAGRRLEHLRGPSDELLRPGRRLRRFRRHGPGENAEGSIPTCSRFT